MPIVVTALDLLKRVRYFVSVLLLLTKARNIEKKKYNFYLKLNEYQKCCLASLLKIVSS